MMLEKHKEYGDHIERFEPYYLFIGERDIESLRFISSACNS